MHEALGLGPSTAERKREEGGRDGKYEAGVDGVTWQSV